MNYATPDWIRRLIAQDHKAVVEKVKSKDGSFRSYIDSVLPFSLYIDIKQIRKEVINKQAKFIQELANELELDPKKPDLIVEELDNAYVEVINSYLKNPRWKKISDQDLENKFTKLQAAFTNNENIRDVLKQEFGDKLIVDTLSIENGRVFLIFPNFDTVSKEFGDLFKKKFNYAAFGNKAEQVKKFLAGNFKNLQNLGHIEIEVNIDSYEEAKRRTSRGLVTPKLLQALLAAPSSLAASLTADFSQQTGQAKTKIVVNKQYSPNKLILEMIVENAFLIGKIEGQAANADKSKLERAYKIGANFTNFLKTVSVDWFTTLQSSKSINTFIADSVLSVMKGKAVKPYKSNTVIEQKTSVKVQTVKVKLPKPLAGTSTVPKLSKSTTELSLFSLQSLINAQLAQRIKQNMGSGNRTDILNLRTGRFAESVKVERLSVSRENMITAFYTYMRNPYATFSEGGRQQYPRSRDPKLLIAKSIREIAQEKVQNRLRAVLV
jgi:hypothetical protein